MIESKTQPITYTLKKLRYGIVDASNEIATNAPAISDQATKLGTKLLEEVSKFEESISSAGELTGRDKISAETLYEVISPEAKIPDIVRIINILKQFGNHLRRAIENFDDVVTRENEMTLFYPIIFQFDYVESISENFRYLVTVLKTALYSHKKELFTREQILALLKMMDLIQKHTNVPDKVLNEVLDTLEIHFDLAGPLGKIDFIE
jgi:vacuolar-type H+-ATPase subunit I/STV1